MRSQREQDKTSENELSEIVLSNLPDMELKEMVIKILTRLERRMEELREDFSKEVENIKKENFKS